ncbi:non-ribosomal peptide synthetase [Kitasatospora phosalacinea]|uniref:PhsB n=1 Tax=Kitasatospora phosalacinea TaxID=2065 RepID=A0A0M3WP24_9ACTN|nr:non-ribosomal peptide synthetase [Kitasatospora phosalacinea]AKO69599.1 PhsB [Kitasatospora phosalacinea]
MSARAERAERIARIWAEVLDLPGLGVEDNVFLLGASSLGATRAAARIRAEFRVELPLRNLFEAPTPAALAALLADGEEDAAGGKAADPGEAADGPGSGLAPEQERLWFLARLHPDSTAYNVPFAFRLREPLDPVALELALHRLVERHEALRTLYPERDGAPVARVLPAAPPALPRSDFGGLPPQEAARRADLLAAEQAGTPFDLAAGPLLRAHLVSFAEDDHQLLLTAHHIITDAWSDDLLLRELNTGYRDVLAGGAAEHPPAPRYRDWAARQQRLAHGERAAEAAAWWRRELAGVPPLLELPTDAPRPSVQRFRGDRIGTDLPAGLVERLGALAAQEDGTLFMALLAGFSALLHRHSGQSDLVVGTPVANRTDPAAEEMAGFCVNTLPLRCDLSGTPSFRELLRRSRERVLDAFDHQQLPFGRLVEALAPPRSAAHGPLVQVMLVLQNTPDRAPAGPGGGPWTAQPARAGAGGSIFDLTLYLSHAAGGLHGEWEFDTDLFGAERIAGLGRQLELLLSGAVDDPDAPVAALPLWTGPERARFLRPGGPAAEPVCLHEMVRAQARRTPDAVAVEAAGEHLTYAALDRRSDAAARALRAGGVGPEDVVAVACERSAELVVALLAVLKAGAAYLPLDPENPRDRLEYLLADSGTAHLLTLERHLAALPVPPGVRPLLLDRLPPGADGPLPAVDPRQAAYLIYTSGSTGRPKGVLNQHAAAANRIRWGQRAFPLGPDSVVLQKTPVHFDISVWEVFWPLASGATVVLARPGGHRDPRYLARLVAERGVTDLHFVPSMLPAFLERPETAGCTALRRVYCSGEALPPALRDRLFAELPGVELHNLYGPTEAAVEVSHWHCRPGDPTVPIGTPIDGAALYVLDELLNPVPPGVPGELYIGGVPVARGYHGRPGLTGRSFLPDPYGAPGARMYRTGDRGRWRPDGAVEYLGRTDHQVKLRGHRIELGEIEAVLREHPGVADAAAVLRPGAGGDPRLVAYLAPAAGPARDDDALAASVRALAAARLPDYMRPAALVVLERFPLTPSGKTDRSALPDPGPGAAPAPGRTAPRTPVERELAAIWAAELGVTGIGVDDGFFELGGHSLLAARVMARVGTAFGVDLPLSAVFELPTVAGLALRITAAQAAQAEEETARLLDRLERLSDEELALLAEDPALLDGDGPPEPGR